MKKKNRLLKNQDFKAVLNKHWCVSRENLKIFYKCNELGCARVGVSVSSKLGNSVVRHKIKRQVVSMMDKTLNYDVPLDLVIIVKNNYLENTYAQNFDTITEGIKYILKKGAKTNEK